MTADPRPIGYRLDGRIVVITGAFGNLGPIWAGALLDAGAQVAGIELAEALWDSITQDGYEPPLTPAQEAEIDRRLEEHERNPQSAIPWEQFKAELEQKCGRRK